MNDNIVSLFNKRLDGPSATKTALVFIKADGTEEKYSWNYYWHKAIYIAEWLKRSGVKKGDFVTIIPLNLPESFFAMLGTILIGAVPVPINIQLLKEPGIIDLRKIIADCKPKIILTNDSLREHLSGTGINYSVIEEAIIISKAILTKFGLHLIYYSVSYPTAKSDDLLIMPYTSGTEGQPKGVMLTHKNVLNRLEAVSTAFNVTENERVLSYLPLGHIAELITTFFGQIYCGYTVYFTEHAKNIVANREKFRKNFPFVLQQDKPTIFIAVPRIWTSFKNEIIVKLNNLPVSGQLLLQGLKWLKRYLIKKGLGLGQTRVFVNTGARIDKKDSEFFANMGISISDVYGQTETAGPLTLNGSVLGSNIKIAIENGEFVVTGDCVMAGYYQNSLANERVFSKNELGETVYHTGDTGIEQDGKIFWTGRIGNGFKWANGEYASPDKIESLEEEIKKIDPRISEAIICGVNRPYSVALVFSENYMDKNLKEKTKQELPKIGEGMYRMQGFALIDSAELELTPTMKVKRNKMLEKCASVTDSLYK